MKICRHILLYIFLLLFAHPFAQTIKRDSSLKSATVQACVQYALDNQPFIQQSYLDERITERQISSRLADWYPQVDFSGSYQHYFQLPSAALGADSTGKRQIIQTGVRNTSALSLAATQNIFNRDVLLASRTAGDVRQQVRQIQRAIKLKLLLLSAKPFMIYLPRSSKSICWKTTSTGFRAVCRMLTINTKAGW